MSNFRTGDTVIVTVFGDNGKQFSYQATLDYIPHDVGDWFEVSVKTEAGIDYVKLNPMSTRLHSITKKT